LEIRVGKPLIVSPTSKRKVSEEMVQTVTQQIADEMKRLEEDER
jgi:hypothetical protein